MVHRRPFSCALCSKRFDRQDQLNKHLFAHPQTAAAAAAHQPGHGGGGAALGGPGDTPAADTSSGSSPAENNRLHGDGSPPTPNSKSPQPAAARLTALSHSQLQSQPGTHQTWNWVIGSPGHHFDPV